MLASGIVLVWCTVKFIGVFLCVSLSVAHCLAASPQRKQSHPDVFLVTIDTLRADHVHCYGYEHIQTPALDGLARDGIRFTQAFTPSPITNSSHTSILTGLLPSSHGVTDFGVPLSAAHATWAELLHRQGYHTAAFIGAVILDSKALAPGLDRGFDFYDNFPQHSRTKSRWGRLERRGMDVAQRAEAWLTAHPQGPHFVWAHLYDPHDPYQPPAPYSQIYKDRLYDGEIAYADSALANFIAYLKKNRWYENSLIVVVGDHGEGLGEHHEDTHGIFLYDSTTHVPLILKLPGGTERADRKVIDEQVRTTDILPTVLDFISIAAPAKLDGESLKAHLAGESGDQSPLTAFGETDYPLRFGWASLRSVRTPESKFIEAPRPELYDLSRDAGELTNHYEPWNEQVKKFREMLAEIRLTAAAASSSNGAGNIGTGKAPASQETVDELKALGYLGRADVGSSTNVPETSMLPDPKDKIEEQNLLHRAMMSEEEGRDTAARETLEKVLQLDAKSYPALRQLGEIELRSGDYAKSAQHLKGALEAHPGDADLDFYEAQALEKIHELPGALDTLEAGLKLKPGQVNARLLLGEVYLELQNFKAAEDQFSAALLLKPESVEGRLGLAKAQIAQRNFTDAERELKAFTETQPGNAEAFVLMAQAYSGMGKQEEALKAEARAKQLRATASRRTSNSTTKQ